MTEDTLTSAEESDPFAGDRALRAEGVLEPFNIAGILTAADIHVATRLTQLAGEDDPDVLLGVGLAVRAPRLGHVCVDLTRIADTAVADHEAPTLPWPDPARWRATLSASPLVSDSRDPDGGHPLYLAGDRLYLTRYATAEARVATHLQRRAAVTSDAAIEDAVAAAKEQFQDPPLEDAQALAIATAVQRGLTVIAGGPGTGKTWTVARLLAWACSAAATEASTRRLPRIALAAPTGKAAARLSEQLDDALTQMRLTPDVHEHLTGVRATTLHQLLGPEPEVRTRFRHGRQNPLVHDLVVVDEASMVSLSLMDSLLDAVREQSRVVLVGDPGQLASVEAGAVLGDIVNPGMDKAAGTSNGTGLDRAVVTLHAQHRFDAEIQDAAVAIRSGHDDRVIELLRRGGRQLTWIAAETDRPVTDEQLGPIRAEVVTHGTRMRASADRGDGRAALEALQAFRVLCAHRRGPFGVGHWELMVADWLARHQPVSVAGWDIGQPVLVTRNDRHLGVFNGDTGVVVRSGHGSAVAFARGSETQLVPLSRLSAVEPLHAMTVHKAQGSQFDHVAVVLPADGSPLLTRELLYTAVTRAQEQVTVIGSEAAVRRAVKRPIARATGLSGRLYRWDLRR